MRTEFRYGEWKQRRMNHIISLPDGQMEALPLLVYLHGAGERGTKLEHVQRHAIPKMIQNGAEIPAIVLCPQCPAEYVWNNIVADLKKLIDEIVEEFHVLPDRICITGSSMGGYGTWEMGMTYRNFFSALAPVCGGAMAWRAQNLRTTPLRTWHGDVDDAVTIANSIEMVDAVKKSGGSASLHVLKGFGHNDGIEEAYNRTDPIPWLLKQRRTDFSYIPEVCEDMF